MGKLSKLWRAIQRFLITGKKLMVALVTQEDCRLCHAYIDRVGFLAPAQTFRAGLRTAISLPMAYETHGFNSEVVCKACGEEWMGATPILTRYELPHYPT